VYADADECVFVLVKSRARYPGWQVQAIEGWHAAENDAFRWTAKRFALDVTSPGPVREFALRFWVPEAALVSGPVRLSCTIAGHPAGTITCDSPIPLEFRGCFTGAEFRFRLDFTVESRFQPLGETRDLGIRVPLLEASHRHTERLPFRVS
jgi:hypothetical protein